MKLTLPFILSLSILALLQGCQGASESESTEASNSHTEIETPEPEVAVPEEVPAQEVRNDGFTLHENNRVVSLNLGQADYNAWVDNDYFYSDFSKVKPVMARIYEKFNDNFDFIFFVINEEKRPASISYSGLNISGVNAVEGIGKWIRPQTSSSFGSSNKLQSTMQLTKLSGISGGPTLHELMHNWGNSIIESYYVKGDGQEARSGGHWGYSSVGGQLGGFELSTLLENVDGEAGKYHAHFGNRKNFGYNANGGNALPYSKLELYLMGFLPSSDVPDTVVFKGLNQTSEEYSAGVFHATTKETITISDIIEKYGERNPSYLNSQTEFKLLTVVLTANELTESQWTIIDNDVKWFSEIIEADENTYLHNFYQATQGRGTINADISAEDIR